MVKIVFLASIFFIFPSAAWAQSGSSDKIIKWCADEGTHVRYASANIQLKGYTPCGQLSASRRCDDNGRRFISAGGITDYSEEEEAKCEEIRAQRSGLDSGMGEGNLLEFQDFRTEEGVHQKNELMEANSNKMDAYMKGLDGLLDGGGVKGMHHYKSDYSKKPPKQKSKRKAWGGERKSWGGPQKRKPHHKHKGKGQEDMMESLAPLLQGIMGGQGGGSFQGLDPKSRELLEDLL